MTDKPENPKLLIDIIEAAVKAGTIHQGRIDEAYRHIVAFKQSISNRSIERNE